MIIAGITNQDSSFFNIESTDIKSKVSNEDIISFSYTEELQRGNYGVLSIYDPDHFYSKILKIGTILDISFGYDKEDFSENSLLLAKKNSTQVFGFSIRKGIKAFVINPSGTSSSRGVSIYNCNFYGKEVFNPKDYQIHTAKPKADLVREVMLKMGCSQMEINFTQGSEVLDESSTIMQNETGFKFLTRIAKEWRTIFRISYNSKGLMTGIFISPEYLESPSVVQLSSGALGGSTAFLEYGKGVSNVIEYSWKNHAGDSGSGANVKIIQKADGTVTFLRYVTKDDKITVYKLETDRIKQRLESVESFTDRFNMAKDFVSKDDFESVKWAFTSVELSTAPQGLGYSMNVKMLGNPLLSAPLRIVFGEGFPVWFTPEESKTKLANFYGKKVEHIIDTSGYKCNIEILDAFTMFGGSLL